MDLRPRKKSKTTTDSDDENCGSAETDLEWTLEQNEANGAENDNDTSLPDTEFDSTEGFRLKTVKCTKQSKHLIWNMFGHLMKNDKDVDKVKDRIYCIKCFEKKKFKG